MNHPQLEAAMRWLASGRSDLAQRELQQYLSRNPDDGHAHAVLAHATLLGDEPERALEIADTALSLDAGSELAILTRGRALQDLGRLDESAECARRLLELDPEDNLAHGLLAAISFSRSKWQETLEHANRGLEFDPECDTCLGMRALANVKLGQPDSAEADLRSALSRDPEDPHLLTNLGFTALHRGDAQAALGHYREALRLDPNSEAARAGLVEAFKARNPLYRGLLWIFLQMSRIPPKTLVIVIVASVFLRSALHRLAEEFPTFAPLLMSLFWGIVAFILATWIAGPLFNLVLRLDRDARHALSREQIRQSNTLGATLALSAACGIAAIFGVVSAGAAALTFAALALPVTTAMDPEAIGNRLVRGMAAGLVLLGVTFVALDRSVQPELSEIQWAIAQGPEDFANVRTEIDLAEFASKTDDTARAKAAMQVMADEAFVLRMKRRKSVLQILIWAFVAYTWIASIATGFRSR